jgi:glutamate-1-semialdehyde aminotransferase
MQREQKRFVNERPKSKALFERGQKSLLSGVPMNWMVKWAGAFPPFVREAQGAHFYDVDGHRYVDFCLGDTGGIGGTLAGNALSLAAMRATLTKVLTKEAFDRMIPMAERWTAGVQKVIDDFGIPWHVTRLGCRAEYLFGANEPMNGTEAHDAMDFELERFMHLYAMNRGILLTPFHNMALMSPATSSEDVDSHSKVFREAVRELMG